jgi:hypothetical protein
MQKDPLRAPATERGDVRSAQGMFGDQGARNPWLGQETARRWTAHERRGRLLALARVRSPRCLILAGGTPSTGCLIYTLQESRHALVLSAEADARCACVSYVIIPSGPLQVAAGRGPARRERAIFGGVQTSPDGRLACGSEPSQHEVP